MRLRSLAVLTALATAVTSLAFATGNPARADAATGPPSRFVPLDTPQRLLDTRDTGAALGEGGVVSVPVVGAAPLPSAGSITAAVLNITVVGPAGVGYWTVWPHDVARPLAANLNVDEANARLGEALALPNLVTVPVGASGIVDVFANRGGHLVVDMLGYYTSASTATSGRFVPIGSPQRVLDTRDPVQVVLPGETREIRVAAAAGASAAVLNITTIASAAGFWVAFPAGRSQPATANLNSLGPFHLTANQVIVPVDADGDFLLFSQSGGHVVVDLMGTFTSGAAPSSAAGLFVPLDAPTRFLDTRDPAMNPLGGATMPLPAWNLEVGVAGHPSIARSDVAAVVANVTITDALRAGYVSATPAGANDPNVHTRATANLHANRAAQTLPNHMTIPVSSRGIDLFTQSGGHLIADVAGFYTGTPLAAPFGTPRNVSPVPSGCVGYATTAVGAIQRGSSPGAVATAQQRLLDLGFWNAGADGGYGLSTSQAVMAFQKWAGLPATSAVDEFTAAALNTTACRPVATITGDGLEVDKGRQIGMFVREGRVEWVINVSTGNGRDYDEEDQRNPGRRSIGVAITPTGSFRIYRVVDEVRYEGTLGTLYRPRFVVGGIAVHGSPSIPNYPASHGCIRVSNPAMDMIWAANLLPMGGRVVIHE